VTRRSFAWPAIGLLAAACAAPGEPSADRRPVGATSCEQAVITYLYAQDEWIAQGRPGGVDALSARTGGLERGVRGACTHRELAAAAAQAAPANTSWAGSPSNLATKLSAQCTEERNRTRGITPLRLCYDLVLFNLVLVNDQVCDPLPGQVPERGECEASLRREQELRDLVNP
jgi:hypothetical protein